MNICPVGAELLRGDGRTNRNDEAKTRIWQIMRKALRSRNIWKYIDKNEAVIRIMLL